jgi:hypothetical protein
VTSGFKNPPNARFATNPIKLEIFSSQGDKIDAGTVMIIPSCNYGDLQSVDVQRSV